MYYLNKFLKAILFKGDAVLEFPDNITKAMLINQPNGSVGKHRRAISAMPSPLPAVRNISGVNIQASVNDLCAAAFKCGLEGSQDDQATHTIDKSCNHLRMPNGNVRDTSELHPPASAVGTAERPTIDMTGQPCVTDEQGQEVKQSPSIQKLFAKSSITRSKHKKSESFFQIKNP